MKKQFFPLIIAFSLGFIIALAFFNRDIPDAGMKISRDESSEPAASDASARREPPPLLVPYGVAEQTEAGGGPTPEEKAVMAELTRRAHAGEYILDSDNPYSVRKRREMVKRAMKRDLPAVQNDRQEILAALNAPPETIFKLTNHAARIAEASLVVQPLLDEISVAKIEYDAKARHLLSPEQYEQFKEFETRQSFEREWKRFGVEGLEDLSQNDLNGLQKSLEQLGIKGKQGSSLLPYDEDPSTSNWLSGSKRTAQDAIRAKISRIDAAALDWKAVAERNQLSEQAWQTLASMIKERARGLREQLDSSTASEKKHAEWLRRMKAQAGIP